MALSDVFQALAAEFDAAVFRDGPEYLVDASPPRIVAVPTDEAFGPPEEYWVTEPHALAQRDANVDFHILGANRSAVELLIAELVTALRVCTGQAHRIMAGRWTLQDAAALTKHGRAYVLQVTFFVPVVATAGSEGTITTVTTTDTEFTGEGD